MTTEIEESFSRQANWIDRVRKLDMGMKENMDPNMALVKSPLAKKEHGNRGRANDCMPTMSQTGLSSKDKALYWRKGIYADLLKLQ